MAKKQISEKKLLEWGLLHPKYAQLTAQMGQLKKTDPTSYAKSLASLRELHAKETESKTDSKPKIKTSKQLIQEIKEVWAIKKAQASQSHLLGEKQAIIDSTEESTNELVKCDRDIHLADIRQKDKVKVAKKRLKSLPALIANNKRLIRGLTVNENMMTEQAIKEIKKYETELKQFEVEFLQAKQTVREFEGFFAKNIKRLSLHIKSKMGLLEPIKNVRGE